MKVNNGNEKDKNLAVLASSHILKGQSLWNDKQIGETIKKEWRDNGPAYIKDVSSYLGNLPEDEINAKAKAAFFMVKGSEGSPDSYNSEEAVKMVSGGSGKRG